MVSNPTTASTYVLEASLAGFVKVADAMLVYGAVGEKFFVRNCPRMKEKRNESF